jgi:hypothetical protein
MTHYTRRPGQPRVPIERNLEVDETTSTSVAAFTYWDRVTDAQGRRFHCARGRLVERFRRPIVMVDKLSLPGWSPTTFHGDYRNLERVEASCALGFDIDGEGTDIDAVADALRNLCGFVYTSFNHAPERHRGRVIVWTSRPVTRTEYSRCWRSCARRLPTVGLAAKDASRLWFVPGVRPGSEYRLIELAGAPLDVEAALDEVAPIGDAIRAVLDPPVSAETSLIKRARAYLAKVAPATSGQRGHDHTFVVASKLARGFSLDEQTTYALLAEWNLSCNPPWSERDLRRKIREAARCGATPIGKLADAPRSK